MPGTILNSVTKKRIADCHIKSASFCTSREALIEIYKAARLSLGTGELFEKVCKALTARAEELGVVKKGDKRNAKLPKM